MSDLQPSELLRRYAAVRRRSLALAEPLSAEDQCVQSMPDASPTKWHLAHTSWFFETVVLLPNARGYRVFDERYSLLFNSYYESLGPRHPRPQRGLLTRPSLTEVHAYRAAVDAAVADDAAFVEVVPHAFARALGVPLGEVAHDAGLVPLGPQARRAAVLDRA